MGLQDKLQHYAAPADTLVVAVEGPLTADAVVDAHLKALAAGRKLVLLHDAPPTAVALRTAARFGATLVDAASVVVPQPTQVLALPPHDELLLPAPEPELIEAASQPEPEVAHAPPLLEEGTLPWDIALATPEPAPVELPEEEFESMPWNVVHHQLLPSGRQSRLPAPRPTQAHDWGLPWPRPMAPTDGLAVADPRLWHAQERIGAIREDLDRIGAPSFGVAKPEGSAWLKRLHEFGSP